MRTLFRSFVRPLLWPLLPLREVGEPGEDYHDTGGVQTDPHQVPTGNPEQDDRGCPPGQHRERPGGPCIKPSRCPPGKVRLSDGKCHDDCSPAQLRANGRNAAACKARGGKWIPTGRCKGRCEGGGGTTTTPTTTDTPTTRPTTPTAVSREQDRLGRILDRAEKVTPESIRASLPEFDPMIGQPPPLPAPSLSDVLADPRYLQAAAEGQRRIAGSAGALGIGGAPVVSAMDASRRSALGPMANMIFGQNMDTARYNLAHGQDTYNRMAGNWQRAWEPTRYGLDYPLRVGGLALGAGDLGLRTADQSFRHWWLPEEQRRGIAHSRWQTGQGNLMGLLSGVFGQGGGGLQPPGW